MNALFVPNALALTYKERFTTGYTLALEQFVGQEFDAAGAKLRQENGQRISFGLLEDNLNWNHPGIIYQGHVRGWLGIYLYEDNMPKSTLTSRASLSSKSDFMGGSAEMLVGQRFGYLTGKHMLEAMGGLNAEAWIHNVRNGGGNITFMRGVRDGYAVLNVKAQVALVNWYGRMRQRLIGGVKYPAAVLLAASDARGILYPPGKLSFYGQFEFGDIARIRGQWLNVALTLDTNRMGAAGPDGIYYQDRSEQFSVGVLLTVH